MSAGKITPPDGIVAADVVMRSDTMSVTRLTLSPGGIVPWHTHSQIADYLVCLSGRLRVEMPDQSEDLVLSAGGEVTIPAGVAHQVVNLDDTPSRYLAIQGVGAYDRHYVGAPDDGPPGAA